MTKLNILFIMYDQLRFDYLSCAGHPTLKTPNFDRVDTHPVRDQIDQPFSGEGGFVPAR